MSSIITKEQESVNICKLLNQFHRTNYAHRKVGQDISSFTRAFLFVEQYVSTNQSFAQYCSGSSYDGTSIGFVSDTTNEFLHRSDSDMLMVIKNGRVINLDNKSKNDIFDGWVFSMENCCNPLFVKLKLLKTPESKIAKTDFLQLFSQLQYRLRHLSTLPALELLTFFKEFQVFKHDPRYCGLKSKELEGPSFPNLIAPHTFDPVLHDYVLCLLGADWPEGCKQWSNRKPNTEWLNLDDRKRILESSQCLLVPVGRPTCKNRDIEWRISFSTVEEKLIQCFNETQFYCCILLKSVVKEMNIKFCNSYIVKTLMFWTLEWDCDIKWCNSDLITGLQRVLSRLYCGILTGFIPHFFVPSHNLLDGKVNEQNRSKFLLTVHEKLLETSHSLENHSKYLTTLKNNSVRLPVSFVDLDRKSIFVLNNFSGRFLKNFSGWSDYDFDIKQCDLVQKLINNHGFTFLDFSELLKLSIGFGMTMQSICCGSKLLKISPDSIADDPFVNECHKHIKLCLCYLSRNDFIKSKYYLDKALYSSFSNFVKLYSTSSKPPFDLPTHDVFLTLLKIRELLKKNNLNFVTTGLKRYVPELIGRTGDTMFNLDLRSDMVSDFMDTTSHMTFDLSMDMPQDVISDLMDIMSNDGNFKKFLDFIDELCEMLILMNKTNDKIWNDWCQNREAVFRASTTQCAPILLHEKNILPYCLQVDLNSQIRGSIYNMLLLPFLPFALFLRIIFHVQSKEIEGRKSQDKEIELILELLSTISAYISPYYKPDTLNLLTIAHLQLRQWSCSVKSALKCAKTSHYHLYNVVFSVHFVQYLLKCIASSSMG